VHAPVIQWGRYSSDWELIDTPLSTTSQQLSLWIFEWQLGPVDKIILQ